MPNFDEGVPSFEDTIAQIQALSEPQEAAEQVEASAPADQPAAEPVPEPTPAPGVEAQVEASPAPVPAKEPVIPALKRVMEKEAALIAREARVAELERRAALADNALARFRADRIGYLKALDPDLKPGELAQDLFYEDLGDLAPKEKKAEREVRRAIQTAEQFDAKLEQAKAEILAQIQQQQAEAAYQQYQGAIAAYAEAVPETVPLVQKFAANQPERLAQALLKVAQHHARATGGEVLTPAQAAAKLEAGLRKLQLEAGPSTPPPSAPTTQPAAQAVTPNTLRNKHTSVQPSRVQEDDLDDEVLFNRAMAEIERVKRAQQT